MNDEIDNKPLPNSLSRNDVGDQYYSFLINSTTIGYCAISLDDGTIIHSNQATERFLGKDKGQIVGQRFVAIVSEEYHAPITSAMSNTMMNADCPATLNIRVQKSLQSYLWVRIEFLKNVNEHLCHIFITDISERKTLEKTLHQYEMQMYATLQALPHGVLILDSNGTVQMCNSVAEKILGLSASQIIEKHSPNQGLRAIYDNGKPIEEAANFLSPAPRRALSPLAAVIKVGLEQQNITIGLYHLTADVRWIAVHSRPLFPENDDAMRGLVISLTDVTEQKQLVALMQGENAQEPNIEASSLPPTTTPPASPAIATTAPRETDALYGDFVTIATATQGNIVLDAKKDILYLEGADDYTRFTTASGKEYTTFGSVGKWEQRLFAQGFLRVHRSTIVNFHAIHSWHFEDNIVFLNMRDGKQIRVSKGYKAYFLSYVR
jgi:PAS domain S-box-containing protein